MIIRELFDNDHLYFIGDPHIGHANIIDYCNRDSHSIEQMDMRFKDDWNHVVTEKDDIFVVGDFFFKMRNSDIKKYIEDLTYNRMYLVIGNHDERGVLQAKYLRDYFTEIEDRFEIRVNDDELSYDFQTIILDHYPMMSWNHMHRGAWHLYGHVHTTRQHPNPNALEVGYDNDYINGKPISYTDVKKLITKQNLNYGN